MDSGVPSSCGQLERQLALAAFYSQFWARLLDTDFLKKQKWILFFKSYQNRVLVKFKFIYKWYFQDYIIFCALSIYQQPWLVAGPLNEEADAGKLLYSAMAVHCAGFKCTMYNFKLLFS